MHSERITGAIMPYLDLILTETLSTPGLVDRYTYLHYKVCYLTPVRDSTLGGIYEPIFSACTCRFNGVQCFVTSGRKSRVGFSEKNQLA